jgi:hypothetical protein
VPGELNVTFIVHTANSLVTGNTITNDGITVASTEVATISGSPFEVTIAPANALTLSPTSQTGYGRRSQQVSYTLTLQNLGFKTDSFDLTKSGNAWATTIWDASFSKQIARTSSLTAGGTYTVGVRVQIPASATNNLSDTVTITAASVANPAVKASAKITTIAITRRILLVDDDAFTQGPPVEVESFYRAALDAAGYANNYNFVDLAVNPDLPLSYMQAHDAIVWFTGESYPAPLGPYEGNLTAYLNGGGRLFVSGQDILDQAAGTTDFVRDYLHVDWDGTDRQNDIGTTTITGVITNPVTSGLSAIPINVGALFGADFSDQITPIAPAIPAFRDTRKQPDALSVADGRYKVVFLAFPFEAITTPANRTTVMQRSIKYLLKWDNLLPILSR